MNLFSRSLQIDRPRNIGTEISLYLESIVALDCLLSI